MDQYRRPDKIISDPEDKLLELSVFLYT
jgi:hypothetical protein